MKNLSVLAIAMAALFVFSCDQKGGSSRTELATLEDSVSYGYGTNIGANIKRSNIEGINPDAMAQGIKDALAEDVKLTDEQMNSVMQAFEAKSQEKETAKNAGYLAANAEKEGVEVTESGLQYKILVEGTGAYPGPTDQVTVHYTGKLVDGTVFDSSVERGEPATFGLNQVIPGWTEGLQLIKEGGKAELTIPSDLGYGPQGQRTIPPNSVLIFEVELISIGG